MQIFTFVLSTRPDPQLFKNNGDIYPHVLFEDVSPSFHFYNTVDDEFTVGSQEVSPLVQSFYFYCLVVLLPV